MIKVGDLVMVVKPKSCCGDDKAVGKVFTAKAVVNEKTYCDVCGALYTGIHIENGNETSSQAGVRAYMCIKIDPPALQDETTTEKELAI